MHPTSTLTASCRRATGDVPPKLVGASTTIVGSKVYLYGGRLYAGQKIMSDIYALDLESFKWQLLTQAQEYVPQARYFHSADTWNNYLIVFGGTATQPSSDNPDDLCVLNDVRMFDLAANRWLPPADPSEPSLTPKARYAHLSSVTSDRLFIIGGQDLNNVWLDDIHVYDLKTRSWVLRRDYPRHCGAYRSVAVTSTKRVHFPPEAGCRTSDHDSTPIRLNGTGGTALSAGTTHDDLIHLPHSVEPTDEFPCDIFLFSNHNFTDVQRDLRVFSPLPESDFAVFDWSVSMTAAVLPPGLRFPSGAVLGTNLIITGTQLSETNQSFSIWALDFVSMTWTRIDPGRILSGSNGSWFRSCVWPEASRLLVFGNRHGNPIENYNQRLISWDHIVCIDLEAYGVYQPPALLLDGPQQELGLAALEAGVLADFEIVCEDGRRIKCSRKVLEDRWPWFKQRRQLFLQAAARALSAVPSVTNVVPARANASKEDARTDPRLTLRALNISEPYPLTLAFLEYLYSMALSTQHTPAVLSQLLIFSSTYDAPHLQSLVKHAMHHALNITTVVGIYEVSAQCSCRSLQIRALSMMMSYSQKHHNLDSGEGNGPDSLPITGSRRLSTASHTYRTADRSRRASANSAVFLHSVVSDAELAHILSIFPPGPFQLGDHGQPSEGSSSSNFTTVISDAFLSSSSCTTSPTSLDSDTFPRSNDRHRPADLSGMTPVLTRRAHEIASSAALVHQDHNGDETAVSDRLGTSAQAVGTPGYDALDPILPPRPYSPRITPAMKSAISLASSPSLSTSSSTSIHSEDYDSDSAYRSPSSSIHAASRAKQRARSETTTLRASLSRGTSSLPSLSGSSSSHEADLTSPPLTPTFPPYAFLAAEPSIAGLDVIHEMGLLEDLAFSVPEDDVPKKPAATIGLAHSASLEPLNDELDKVQDVVSELRVRAASPETSSVSALSSNESASSKRSSKQGALSRLFTRSSKLRGDPEPSFPSRPLSRAQTHTTHYDPSMTKAEEKRRKKQVAKERTEALARRFETEDDAAKSADGQQSLSFRAVRRTVPAWEEEGGIYSGIGW